MNPTNKQKELDASLNNYHKALKNAGNEHNNTKNQAVIKCEQNIQAASNVTQKIINSENNKYKNFVLLEESKLEKIKSLELAECDKVRLISITKYDKTKNTLLSEHQKTISIIEEKYSTESVIPENAN